MEAKSYEARVRELEAEGLSTSDAQAAADAEEERVLARPPAKGYPGAPWRLTEVGGQSCFVNARGNRITYVDSDLRKAHGAVMEAYPRLLPGQARGRGAREVEAQRLPLVSDHRRMAGLPQRVDHRARAKGGRMSEIFLRVISNGSRWMGEEPATVEELLEVMARTPLDPRFEDYGGFIGDTRGAKPAGYNAAGKRCYIDTGPIYPEHPQAVRFWGNFFELSHVFEIDTDDPETIEKITRAIRANQSTPAYKAARKARGLPAEIEREP